MWSAVRFIAGFRILEWTGPVRPIASGGVETGEWDSREEWNEAKPGWEWLFPFSDKNKDGKISTAEHTEFQEYKKQHPDWQKRARAELGGK